MSDIEWHDAPPRAKTGAHRNAGVWIDRLKPFVAHPGQWGVVQTKERASQAASAARNLRNGFIRHLPPGRWDFAARGNDVWACYLGPDE